MPVNIFEYLDADKIHRSALCVCASTFDGEIATARRQELERRRTRDSDFRKQRLEAARPDTRELCDAKSRRSILDVSEICVLSF